MVPKVDAPALPPVDRNKACPFLLRVFFSDRKHNDIECYGETPGSGVTPPNELQLYTWEDCTLRELTNMFKNEHIEVRRSIREGAVRGTPSPRRRDARGASCRLPSCTRTSLARTP